MKNKFNPSSEVIYDSAGQADGWNAVLHWSSTCTGINAEVRIKQTILLHEDDDMLNFVKALQIA